MSTGKALQFKTSHFIDISSDSLSQLIQEAPLKSIEVQSNNYFWIHHHFTKIKKKQFKKDYPNDLRIESIKSKLEKAPFTPYVNPKIKTLKHQIENLKLKDERSLESYQDSQNQLQILESKFEKENSLFAKEQLLKEIRQLQKIQMPKLNTEKITSIKVKIAELQSNDQIKNAKKHKDIEAKFLKETPTATKFSGLLVRIIIAQKTQPLHSGHYPFATPKFKAKG